MGCRDEHLTLDLTFTNCVGYDVVVEGNADLDHALIDKEDDGEESTGNSVVSWKQVSIRHRRNEFDFDANYLSNLNC